MLVNLFTFKNGTYSQKENGLFGTERKVLKSLFNKENEPIHFEKLTGLQKKIIRKMGWPKEAFLKKYQSNKK
jgi:hypothetical protein